MLVSDNIDSFIVETEDFKNVKVLNHNINVINVNRANVTPNSNSIESFSCQCNRPVCVFDIRNNFATDRFSFGFIPLEPLAILSVTSTPIDRYLKAGLPFSLQGASKPNCIGSGIPINTVFNLSAWEKYLHNYWDHQL